MPVCYYLDESGDLGWSLDLPFGRGGSSQHLTIATVSCEGEDTKYIGRLIKDLKEEFGYKKKREMKWIDLSTDQRLRFAQEAKKLIIQRPDFNYHGLVVRKRQVRTYLRDDSALLYNYLVKTSLFDDIVQHESVTLIPDPQAIAPNTGAPLHHYLRHQAFEYSVINETPVTSVGFLQKDSRDSVGIQFADMLSGVIQQHHEGVESSYYRELQDYINLKRLFFDREALQAVV